jgi:hypothetical protein
MLKVLSLQYFGGTEENHRKPQSVYPVPVPRSLVFDNGVTINILLRVKIFMWLEQYNYTFAGFEVLTLVM